MNNNETLTKQMSSTILLTLSIIVRQAYKTCVEKLLEETIISDQ
jgi:hypothetical protein